MVRLVKLVTGEEVLAGIEIADDKSVTMSNPMKLALSPKGLAMVPLSPFMQENSKITIQQRDIMYMVEADEDVLNGYNQQFGSGIITAPAGLRLT